MHMYIYVYIHIQGRHKVMKDEVTRLLSSDASHIHTYTHTTRRYIYIHTCVHIFTNMHIHIQGREMGECIYIHICINMYIHVHINMHICTYIYRGGPWADGKDRASAAAT